MQRLGLPLESHKVSLWVLENEKKLGPRGYPLYKIILEPPA